MPKKINEPLLENVVEVKMEEPKKFKINHKKVAMIAFVTAFLTIIPAYIYKDFQTIDSQNNSNNEVAKQSEPTKVNTFSSLVNTADLTCKEGFDIYADEFMTFCKPKEYSFRFEEDPYLEQLNNTMRMEMSEFDSGYYSLTLSKEPFQKLDKKDPDYRQKYNTSTHEKQSIMIDYPSFPDGGFPCPNLEIYTSATTKSNQKVQILNNIKYPKEFDEVYCEKTTIEGALGSALIFNEENNTALYIGYKQDPMIDSKPLTATEAEDFKYLISTMVIADNFSQLTAKKSGWKFKTLEGINIDMPHPTFLPIQYITPSPDSKVLDQMTLLIPDISYNKVNTEIRVHDMNLKTLLDDPIGNKYTLESTSYKPGDFPMYTVYMLKHQISGFSVRSYYLERNGKTLEISFNQTPTTYDENGNEEYKKEFQEILDLEQITTTIIANLRLK